MTCARYIHPPAHVPRDRRPVINNDPPEEAFYDRIFSAEELAEYLRLHKPMLVFELALTRHAFGNMLDYIRREELSEEEIAKFRPVVYGYLRTINDIRSKINEAILDWDPLWRKLDEVVKEALNRK